MIANVHSIETFSSLDGPGIRYVLFLQGCNLACKYCHNIDTIPRINYKQMSVDEVVNDFLKYKAFYQDGDITISGGEPLLQLDFIIALFEKLKEYNVHTAIQTQGTIFQDNPKFRKLIDLTNLFIVDLKGVNNTEVKKITNVKLDNTFLLLDILNKENKKFYITYVLVPEINNSNYHIEELGKILKRFNQANYKFKVLKYHKLGLDKWTQLGIKYELDKYREATSKDVGEFLDKLKSYIQ